MKRLFFTSLIFLSTLISAAQSVGISGTGAPPQPSAIFDLSSTTKGLLIPRMSTAQRKAITAPAAGLLVFDLDKSTIYLFDGQKWQAMLFSNSDAVNPPIGRSASDGAAGDKFGTSVSISGDYAIIGAYNEAVGSNTGQGAAYIFARQGGLWTEQSKLIASDGAAGDNFGTSVSISGDYAIVGSPKGSGAWFLQGAAYIFVRSGSNWSQQAKINSSDGVIGETFGTSVSINGDYAIVGNPNATLVYANQGAAYIFVRNGVNWSQQSKLTYAGGQYNDYFGLSVSINGDYAIIGAPYFDWSFANQGSAFIFIRSGTAWTLQERINSAGGAQDDDFGMSVCINGDYAIIGAPNSDGEFANEGSAYIFLRSGTTWGQQAKLIADNNQANANYGNNVSLNQGYAIVGAIYENVGLSLYHSMEGSAYIYQRSFTNWQVVRVVKDGTGQISGFFGSAVGVSGYNYIIGATGKNNSKGEVSFLNNE